MSSRCMALGALTAVIALSACKPPPTDADMVRDMPEAAPVFASDPLPSPETEGAFWAVSEADGAHIIYGVQGSPALLAIGCVADGLDFPVLQITRFSPADDGAKALLAMVGNGHIGRIEVDSDDMRGRGVWSGGALASDTVWEPLTGPRQLTATVPGAGMVTINPSPLPAEFIAACRNGEELPKSDPVPDPAPDPALDEEAEVGTETETAAEEPEEGSAPIS